jgi:hypothetical protein
MSGWEEKRNLGKMLSEARSWDAEEDPGDAARYFRDVAMRTGSGRAGAGVARCTVAVWGSNRQTLGCEALLEGRGGAIGERRICGRAIGIAEAFRTATVATGVLTSTTVSWSCSQQMGSTNQGVGHVPKGKRQ